MLLADARGIVVVPSEKSLPNNLTVLSAASGGQFSGALKEKEHGLFTYYVPAEQMRFVLTRQLHHSLSPNLSTMHYQY